MTTASPKLRSTNVPERWSRNWEDNLRLAHLADAAGMAFHLPVGRWRGCGGATNFAGSGFVHPIVAVKQLVTTGLLGRRRFGLKRA